MAQNDPSSNPGGGPPDLDEVIAKLQRALRRVFSFGGKHRLTQGNDPSPNMTQVVRIVIAAAALLWVGSGFYIVDAGNVGMILRFGRLVEITQAGPHWHLPWPIEAQAEGSPLNLAQVRTVEVGYRTNVRSKVPAESLVLTDDENIVDVQFAVQYTIKDPQAYLFNNRAPEEAVMQAAETAIREVIGKSKMDFVLYEGRAEIAQDAAVIMQTLLDRYKTGISISKVNMQNAQPPEQVQAAFDDAVKAGQDRERQKNEGQAYANDIIPKARGDAARLMAEAQGYSQRVVARAQGDASRFKQLYAEYQKSPDVMRQRLYLDMMQQVLSNTTKVIADQKGQGGSLLYLPLDKLVKGTEPSEAAKAAAPESKSSAPEAPRDIRDSLRSRDREGRP